MDDESREELESLVVSYLQSLLNEYPWGVPLAYFERTFAEKTEEARDWYTRFKARNTLQALQSIPNAVNISNDNRTNGIIVSINKTSDKADPLLIDLIIGQKSSSKRKRPNASRATSQRVRDSFDLNRNSGRTNGFQPRIGSQPSGAYGGSRYSSQPPTARRPPPESNRSTRPPSHDTSRSGSLDPRLRQASQGTPTQTRHAATPPIQPLQPSQQFYSNQQSYPSPQNTSQRLFTPPKTSLPGINTHSLPRHSPVASATNQTSQKTPPEPQRRPATIDPNLESKRTSLRQRLIQLLMMKSAEVKLLYLPYLYNDHYQEELDPKEYGHNSISTLLQDPFFSDYFKIDYKEVYSTVSLKIVGVNDGPVAPVNGNATGAQRNSSGPFGDHSRSMTDLQKKFNAIDTFSTSTMIKSLEPLPTLKPVLGRNQIEEIILYRTMRLILTSKNQCLKLDEWERKYQQTWNYNNRIKISDYGCRTLLEFFKCLATELPIKTHLVDDEWVAKSSVEAIKDWINTKLAQGKYKVLIVMDPKYDQVAYPGETYPLQDTIGLDQEYYPVVILAVNRDRIWLQIRNQTRIKDHLTIETSLTCYEDHKKRDYFKVCPALVKVGFPCVAYDEIQQRWCRAMIIDVPKAVEENNIVTVFLVDYALKRKVSTSQLSCILKNHLKHPVGLVYAQLHGIDNDKVDLATRMLKEYTSPPATLACKIVASKPKPRDEVDTIWSLKKDIKTVILVDTRQGKDCNLADAINTCTSTIED